MSGVNGLDTKYVICDQKGKVISALDCAGSTPFFDDTITNAIATNSDQSSDGTVNFPDNFLASRDLNANSKEWESTLEISVPISSPISKHCVLGNILMDYDEVTNKWYAYKIWSESNDHTDMSGHQVNKLQCINLLNWRLAKYIPTVKQIRNINGKTAFQMLLAPSGWTLDWQAKSQMFGNIDFDGQNNAQSYLQTMLQTYDVEIEAYVKVDGKGITRKICTVVDKLGSKTPVQSFYYGRNITGITKTTIDSNLITKLWVRDANGKDISDINGGNGFLVDNEANDLYNGGNDDYLEGVVVSQTIKNHAALLTWGHQVLKVYNHPRANYEITVPSNYNIKLGDTVSVVDYTMTPAITITARAIQVEKSKANRNFKITFGEFIPIKVVTPNAIQALRNELNNNIDNLITQAKNDITLLTSTISTPDGTSFRQNEEYKRAIGKVFINSVNVTNYCTPQAFLWSLNNPNGTPNVDWINRWDNGAKGGYLQGVDEATFGDLQLNVDLDAISDTPQITIDEKPNNSWISSYNIQKIRYDASTKALYFIEGNKLHRTTDFGKTVTTMTINNIYTYDFATDGFTIYMMSETNGIVSFTFTNDSMIDITKVTAQKMALSQSYHFDYDASNNMVALISGKQILIVQDNSDDTNPFYYISDYSKLGISGNISDFVLKYPNMYMILDTHKVVGYNVINESPIFSHSFDYKSGMPTGNEVSISQDSNHFYIATNTTDSSASTEIVDVPAILRADPTAITEDPKVDLVPNAVEQAGFSSLNSKLAAIQNSGTVSFGYITDTHVSGYGNDTVHTVPALRHIKAFSYFAKNNSSVKMTIHNGDLDDGEAPIQDTMNDVDMAIEALQLSGKPFAVSQGNHDDNSGYARDFSGRLVSQVFDPQKSYEHRINKFSEYITLNKYDRTNMYGTYALTDKIDMIFLNSFDLPYNYAPDTVEDWVAHQRSCFMQQQISWLITTLQNIPDDHQVLIVTHCPIRNGAISNSSFVIKQRNGNLISGILEAFQNGTKFSQRGYTWSATYKTPLNTGVFTAEANVDFSGKPTKRIIAVLSGHTHEDKDNFHNNVLYTQTLDSLPGRCPTISRVMGESSEDAWDIVTIDPSARKIYFSRYGAGVDREYNY